MQRKGILSILASVLVYGFIAYLVIALFISVFPWLVVLILGVLLILAVLYIIRIIRAGIKQVVNPAPQFDEFGSRKAKISVIDMTDADTKKE